MKASDQENTSRIPEFFVVLEDRDEAARLIGCLPAAPARIVSHPSGRPWIAAVTPFSTLTHVSAGNGEIVLIGPGAVSPAEIRFAFGRRRDITDLGGLIERLPGVYHVAARIAGAVRVQGTASGVRRLFTTRVAGSTVVSDRADVLAWMIRAEVDDAALAVRLLEPLPHPLADRSPWRGIQAVPPHEYLVLGEGSPRLVSWWEPPAPHLSLGEGAPRVLDALDQAVRAHVSGHHRISSELSGGYDSTSLTFLAHARFGGTAGLFAVTAASRDPFSEDLHWANKAAAEMPDMEHHVIRAEDLPLVYAGVGEMRDVLDEPSTAVVHSARVLSVLGTARDKGSRIHLTGHGGDHLFVGLPTLYRDLLPKRPLFALRRLNAYRNMFAWPVRESLRQLTGHRTYGEWLRRSARRGLPGDYRTPIITWGIGATLHTWLTPLAEDLIRTEIGRAAATVRPLAPTPGRHFELDGIRDGARLVRALMGITGSAGLPISAPYFDDRVIEAALAVQIEERADPWTYKPLLREAMRPVVPAHLLERATKDAAGMDEALGLRAFAGSLRDLWADSRLARRGLIDADRLTGLCARPDSPELMDGSVLTTVACELWLRSAEEWIVAAKSTKGECL